MIKTETKLVERQVIVEVICNKCGEKAERDGDSSYCLHARYDGGYYSRGGICDMDKIRFDLCEDCISAFVDTFKISARSDPLDPVTDGPFNE